MSQVAFDALGMIANEVAARTDLTHSQRTMFVKVLTLLPMVYEAGYNDGLNTREGGEEEVESILAAHGINCSN